MSEPREEEPLLASLGHEEVNETRTNLPTYFQAKRSQTASATWTVLYFMALHFLIAFIEMVLVAPLLRLEEESICIRHYYVFDPSLIGSGGNIDEQLCKIGQVQGPLARIRGWKSLLDTIPVLLVAIPLGNVGDRIGRRKIIAISLLGVGASLVQIFVVCAFPTRIRLEWIYLSSALLLVGGGLYSATAFMWAMASDCFPAETRSHAFYYIFSAFYIAELVASALAASTIDVSPWIGCGLAIGAVLLCLLLLWIVPTPKGPQVVAVPDESITITTTKSILSSLKQALWTSNVRLLLPAFLVGTLRYTTLNVAIPYASVRFGLKISQGATFYTETAIINIILFLFIIPRATAHLTKNHSIDPQSIDRTLVRASLSLLCIGSLLIGLLPSRQTLPIGICIFAAGFGSRVSALSLISYWIPSESKATLYAAIAVLENLGHAIGDPSMQQLFATALELPSHWLALPFYVTALLYALALSSSMFVRSEAAE